MSYERQAYSYRSLPGMQPRTNAFLSPQRIPNDTRPTKLDNTEELAKLDELLADLLSEVDQPMLLNDEGKVTNWNVKPKGHSDILKGLDDIERSVDYLNEKRERTLSKKGSSSVAESPYQNGYPVETADELIYEENDNSASLNAPVRQIRSKLDYFVSNSNDAGLSNVRAANLSGQRLTKSFVNPSSSAAFQPTPYDRSRKLVNTETQTASSKLPMQNKPPVSPTPRAYYSLNRNLPGYRSGTNSAIMKNINETDDENINDFDDRCSVISSTSTIQRSKYHTISNNFVELTKPLPSTAKNFPKRALSAPPADMGKIVLQRLELRSPLTVPGQNIRPMDSQSQVDASEHAKSRPTTTGPYLSNRYNNRGILKTNTLQPQPQRVFTRSSSERPTNGYDTDTGLMNYNYRTGYRNGSHTNIVNNNSYALDTGDSDMESLPQFRINSPQDAHHGSRYEVNGYDTDGGLASKSLNGRRSLEPRLMSRNMDSATPYSQPIQIDRISAPNSNLNENGGHVQKVQRSSVDAARRIPVQLVSGDENENVDRSAFQSINKQSGYPQKPQKAQNGINGSQLIRTSLSNIPNGLSSENRDARAAPSRIATNDSTVISNQSALTNNNFDKSTSQIATANNNKENNILLALNSCIIDNSCDGRHSKVNFNSQPDSRRSSVTSPSEGIEAKNLKAVKANQHFWYKPSITREQAINLLKDKLPGTFIIRDSNNFPGAFGLALKVEKLPSNIPIKPNVDQSVELVRHFLIEPTSKGVRIKGCLNEPIFLSLAALVYQHSLTTLALPCQLILPTNELQAMDEKPAQKTVPRAVSNTSIKQHHVDPNIARQLLERGAACHVYYLNSVNVGNLNGLGAVAKAVSCTKAVDEKDAAKLLLVQFKVNSQGVFMSDINKKKFSRKLFPTNSVLFCAIDDKKPWPLKLEKIQNPKIFGMVCKPRITSGDNECHLFVELDPDQPAIAIVDFINRYLIPSKTVTKEK